MQKTLKGAKLTKGQLQTVANMFYHLYAPWFTKHCNTRYTKLSVLNYHSVTTILQKLTLYIPLLKNTGYSAVKAQKLYLKLHTYQYNTQP